MINEDLKIDILPEEGKKELMDFYEFLLKKYGISISKKKKEKFIRVCRNSGKTSNRTRKISKCNKKRMRLI